MKCQEETEKELIMAIYIHKFNLKNAILNETQNLERWIYMRCALKLKAKMQNVN